MGPTNGESNSRFSVLKARTATHKLLLSLALATGGSVFAVAPSTVLAQDQAFTCSNRSGGASESQAQLTAVRFAHHYGYDRIVFEFAGVPRVPSYHLTQQGTSFTMDPKGGSKTIEGSAGLRTVFSGTDWTKGVPLNDARPGLPVIREVANVGNFEGYTSYGIGLSNRACFRTLELVAPARLVIDFQAPGSNGSNSASVSGASTSDPGDPASLAQTGAAQSQAGHSNDGALAPWLLLAGLGGVFAGGGALSLALRRRT